MISPRIPHLIILTITSLILAGCATGTPGFDPRKPKVAQADFQNVSLNEKIPVEMLKPNEKPFQVGVGDKIEIEILNIKNTRELADVMPDGMIYYQNLDGFKATGMTLPELKKNLEEKLKKDYKAPQVSLIVREVNSQSVSVLGRVNTPGIYPITQPMTVLEAVSKAGGLQVSRFSGTTEELADLKHSFLMRDGKMVPVDFYRLIAQGDMSQNIYLKNGDYIYLPSALSREVYVLGAVNQPRAVGFVDQVTLAGAVAKARGVLPNAFTSQIIIVRGSLTEPQVAVINLGDILAGKATDIILEPRDIVWVPNSPWERVDRYTRQIIGTFVEAVSINAGSRFAVPDASPAAISISTAPAD